MRSRLLVSSLLLLVVSASMVLMQQPSVAQRSRYLQVAIPGYIFSDDLRSWELIADRSAFIPIVVVNPRNGPNVYAGTRCDGNTPPNDPGTGPNLSGLRFDDDFVSPKFPNDPKLVTSQTNYLATLEQHFVRRSSVMAGNGIGVYGYVWSNTNGADPGCGRTLGIVGDEIDLYKRAYGISNIFLDDASGVCPNDTLRSMTDLARSKGAKVILNVGSPAGACVATQAEVIGNFEGTPASYFGAKDALIANASLLRAANPNIKIWHIVYGVNDAEISGVINQATTSADYLYITDDTTQALGCDRGNSNFDALLGMWPLIRQDVPGCASRLNGNPTSFAQVVTWISKGELPSSVASSTVPPGPAATGAAVSATSAPLTFEPAVATSTTSTAVPMILSAPIVSSASTTTNAPVATSAPPASATTIALPASGRSGGSGTTTSSSTTTTTTALPKAVSPVPTSRRPSVPTTTKKPTASNVTTIRVVVQKKPVANKSTAAKKPLAPKTPVRQSAKKIAKKPVVRKPLKKVATRK